MAALHHELHGEEGPWLTLVHGGLVHSGSWKRQVADLARWCRLLTYDLRGYGRSPSAPPAHGVGGHTADLLTLWDELGIESSAVLGFSLGGLIAQDVALSAPRRVGALVLVSTSGRLDDAARHAFLERAHSVDADGLGDELGAHVERAFSPGFREQQPEVVARYAGEIARADATVLADTFRAVATFDRLDELGEIGCPTLVLAGEHDEGMHSGHARELASRIPDATLVVVPGVGHTMHVEAPTTFNQIVADFVTSAVSEGSRT